jgi:hypothetical protein
MTNPKKKSKVVYNKGYKKQKQPENSAEIAVNEVRDVDEHPLQNGHFLVIKYRDESHRLARVFAISSYFQCINLLRVYR